MTHRERDKPSAKSHTTAGHAEEVVDEIDALEADTGQRGLTRGGFRATLPFRN